MVKIPIEEQVMWECVDENMAEVLRKKTEAERLAIANRMWRSARRIIEQQLSREHPEWSQVEIQQEIARRLSHGAV